jgi:hypothetical protein
MAEPVTSEGGGQEDASWRSSGGERTKVGSDVGVSSTGTKQGELDSELRQSRLQIQLSLCEAATPVRSPAAS